MTVREVRRPNGPPPPEKPLKGAQSEEWRDHLPSGYEDIAGYGQVSCLCGWDSSAEKLGWEEHIDAATVTSSTRPLSPKGERL